MQKLQLEINSKDLVLMSNLYLNKEFPHNFLTLGEVSKLLNISKATAISLTRGLEKKGLITKVRGYITFYYPINDLDIRRSVIEKLGLFR
jgi:DNA-binding MarR family transcriptional regulator